MDIPEFKMDGIKPFFDGGAAVSLANVALHLDSGLTFSTSQHTRTFCELTKPTKAACQLHHLPGPGESRHCILKGDFALFDFIPPPSNWPKRRSPSWYAPRSLFPRKTPKTYANWSRPDRSAPWQS